MSIDEHQLPAPPARSAPSTPQLSMVLERPRRLVEVVDRRLRRATAAVLAAGAVVALWAVATDRATVVTAVVVTAAAIFGRRSLHAPFAAVLAVLVGLPALGAYAMRAPATMMAIDDDVELLVRECRERGRIGAVIRVVRWVRDLPDLLLDESGRETLAHVAALGGVRLWLAAAVGALTVAMCIPAILVAGLIPFL